MTHESHDPSSRPSQPVPARRRVRGHWAARLLRLALIGYVTWCVGLFVMQDRMIFPRDLAHPPVTSRPANTRFEQWWLDVDDETRVEAWYLPGRGRTASSPGPAVIFAHGNAEIVDDVADFAHRYASAGVSTLLPEYRGYGRAGGKPSQAGIVADYLAFHDRLAARPEVRREQIFFHGRSLGGGIVGALAARRAPAALILESTCTSVASFCHGYGVPEFLCRHPMRTDRVIAALGRPILIFHGTHDDIIPVSHGRTLHALAPGSTYVEMDAAHNDFPTDLQAYWREIRAFLAPLGLWQDATTP